MDGGGSPKTEKKNEKQNCRGEWESKNSAEEVKNYVKYGEILEKISKYGKFLNSILEGKILQKF